MQVIATAGHVDHGKSTLLRALTGMEPDRWAEERRRGMTIDLGYAWMILPSGERMAFVDVPGHERFATNMLAGVGPVPAVLLVIAADSGWSAQTEEHVRALHALRVRHGVVAVTRCDLADPTTAIADARMRLETTTLSTLPVVAVSGTTRTGIDSLVAELDALAGRLPAADGSARVRLWLDRSFVIRGSGTVVTGTLRSGTLRRDDVLEVAGRTVTVRALQCLGEEMPQVTAPARVAVNLRAVAHADVRRGDTLLTPHAWRPGRIVDVRLDSGGTPPARVVVHVGSAAVSASVRALAEDSPVVRLTLLRTLPLEVGDRLLLRDPGARAVLGGATVLDPWPPPLRRRGAARERAAALGGDDGRADLEREVARRLAVRPELLRAIGVAVPDELPAGVVRAGGWLVAAAAWRRWLDQLDAVTTQQHSSLLDAGTGTTEVAALLGLPDVHLVDALVRAAPQLETAGGRVRRRGAGPALRADLSAAVGRLEQRLTRTPFVAPERPALSALGLGRRELGAAAAAGAILRLPGDVVLMPTAPALAAARLAELPQPFTMSAARQALGTTRRVAVPLLEHLDTLRVTERLTPDLRTVRTAPQA